MSDTKTRDAIEHVLKLWPHYFDDVTDGRKSFDVRLNDRDYRVGDVLRLREWNPASERYSGRETRKVVVYILKGSAMVAEGYVVLGLAAPPEKPAAQDWPHCKQIPPLLVDADKLPLLIGPLTPSPAQPTPEREEAMRKVLAWIVENQEEAFDDSRDAWREEWPVNDNRAARLREWDKKMDEAKALVAAPPAPTPEKCTLTEGCLWPAGHEKDGLGCWDAEDQALAGGPPAQPTEEVRRLREAREYCEEMFSPEWLADPRNRSIFASHIYRILTGKS